MSQPAFPGPITPRAESMKTGDKAVFGVEAMEIDDDRNGWINPASVPKGIPPGDYLDGMAGEPLLQLERTDKGFRVNLRAAQNVTWNPEPKNKLAGWIPVIEWIIGVTRLVFAWSVAPNAIRP